MTTITNIRALKKRSSDTPFRFFGCKSCMWFRFVESLYKFDKGYKCLHPQRGLSERCPKTM